MKYLKLYENYVNKDQSWSCTSEAIVIIEGILKMMKIDCVGHYDREEDLDGHLEYHQLADFDFEIDGYEYSIVIDVNELDTDDYEDDEDDDVQLYQGCSIRVHFFTLSKDDPNYNMDSWTMENGKELLEKLIDIKGNPWINKINENDSDSDSDINHGNKNKMIRKIREILSYLADEFASKYRLSDDDPLDEVTCPFDESFLYNDFYNKFNINTDFDVYKENGKHFKFGGFYESNLDRKFTLYNNFGGFHDSEIKHYTFEEIKEESLWKIIILLSGVPDVSEYLNNDIFRQINENNSNNTRKFEWECTTEAIDIITKILKKFNINYIKEVFSGNDDLDGIVEKSINAKIIFKITEIEYSIYILPEKLQYAYDGSNIKVKLWRSDYTYGDEKSIMIKNGFDLYNQLSYITGESHGWMKKLNGLDDIPSINEEVSKDKFEWANARDANELIHKILNFTEIKYSYLKPFRDENIDLNGTISQPNAGHFTFRIKNYNYNIIIIAKRIFDRNEYDGSDITVLFDECDENGYMKERSYPKNVVDLFGKLSEITGDEIKWMKNINGIKENNNNNNNNNMKHHIQSFRIFEKKNTFVNFSSFNVEEWYSKLNKQFFNDKLKSVPLRWNQSKKELGVVKWDQKSMKIDHLGLSDKFKLTEAELLSVLAHEMIHVWQIQNKKTDGHGTHFKKEMERINDKTKWGINVMTEQPLGHLKMTNPDLDKDFGFIVIKNNKTDFDIAIFNPDKTDYKNILTIIQQNLKKGKTVDVEVRSTQNGTVKQYKKESTNKTISTFKLDDLTFNTLMNDSKKIYGGTVK